MYVQMDRFYCFLNSNPFLAVPQWIIFKLGAVSTLYKLGIYLHGENNQNPASKSS